MDHEGTTIEFNPLMEDREGVLDRVAILAEALGLAPDRPAIFRALRDFVVASMPCNSIFISLYDPEQALRTCVYAWSEGVELDVSTFPPLAMTGSPHSRAVASNQIVISDRLQAEIHDKPHLDVGLEIDPRLPESSIAVPMAVLGQVIGGFEVQAPQPAAYTAAQVPPMRVAGTLAAIALQNVQLVEDERRARAEADRAAAYSEFLAEVGGVLATSLDYETTLQSLADLMVPVLADWCAVDLLDESGQLRRLAVAHADSLQAEQIRDMYRTESREPDPPSGPAHVVRTGQPRLYAEITDEMLADYARDAHHLESLRHLGLKSAMIVPLVTGGRVTGALSLVVSESGRRYGPLDLTLAKEVGWRAGIALENARLYAEAQEAISIRDAFLSVASHELKTPLAVLQGHADLLSRRMEKDGVCDERLYRSAEAIHDQARRLDRLIDTLLDFSRIQSGRLTIEREVVDLCAVTRTFVEGTRATLEQHNFELICPPDPILVRGDSVRLEQVLQNLIGNAIKYSPSGGQITVRLEEAAPEAILTVADRGIGIPTEALDQLFTRFYRAPNVDPRQISGVGLGLYIVQEIIALHGGRIDVESAEGQGSTFTIHLPLATH